MWPLNSLMLWHHILVTALSLAPGPKPFLVVLDPGHGGTEKGACRPGTNLCEKDLTLKVARKTARLLAPSRGIRVLLTRTDDRHRPLYDRVLMAQNARADLLISIHANASPKRNQTGYEIYVYPDKPRLGEPGLVGSGDSVSPTAWATKAILADLERDGLGRCSREFGALLRTQLHRSLGRRKDRGLLTGEMAVLSSGSVPSVLFEMGFIDHRIEGRRIEEPAYQRRIVRALVLAIRRWARKAEALGCGHQDLHTSLQKRGPLSSPRPFDGQESRTRPPKILRKSLHGMRRHRQLVVSADPRWRRPLEP